MSEPRLHIIICIALISTQVSIETKTQYLAAQWAEHTVHHLLRLKTTRRVVVSFAIAAFANAGDPQRRRYRIVWSSTI